MILCRFVCRIASVIIALLIAGNVPCLRADERPIGTNAEHCIQIRGSLSNSLKAITGRQTAHVAFLGGSITEMDGYRPRVEKWLTEKFPESTFTFTNAGIASTCSHTGAVRLQRDVLSKGQVDLLFVEFAVNDDQDAHHSADDCIRGMEGIVRQVVRHNPSANVVMVHFVNPEILASAQSGNMHLSVQQHEKVAQHYGICSINLAAELTDRIAAGTMTWESYGGTHPGPIGNQLAADMVTAVLDAGWQADSESDMPVHSHWTLPTPLLDSSFDHARFLSADDVHIDNGWQHGVPAWQMIHGNKRDRFLRDLLYHATEPGATLHVTCDGQSIGAYVLAGPDAGQLEVQIDDGEWRTHELYHAFSRGLHYPRTIMFAVDLADGKHDVKVRLAKTHHRDSNGTAARILNFVAAGQ